MRSRSRRKLIQARNNSFTFICPFTWWMNQNCNRELVPPEGQSTYEDEDWVYLPTVEKKEIDNSSEDKPVYSYEYMLDDLTDHAESMAEWLYRSIYIANYGLDSWREMQKAWNNIRRMSRKAYTMKYCRHIRKTWKNHDAISQFRLRPEALLPIYDELHLVRDGIYGWEHRIYRPEARFSLPSVTDGLIPSAEFCSSASRAISPGDFFGTDLCRRCQQKVLKNALPSMEDGFSLPVFVAELKDVPGMIRGATELVRHAPGKLRALFKTPFREWSKHQLAASFGWLPFVSDIQTIIERLVTLREDVLQFIEDAGKRRTYHYTIRLDYEDLGKPSTWLDLADVGSKTLTFSDMGSPFTSASYFFKGMSYDVKKQRSISNIMYTATIDYSYTLSDFGQWGPILAGLDRFGLNVSLSDFWEIIPFSFVVDWFFRVESLVERLDCTNLPAQLVINEYCESLKFGYAEHYLFENCVVDNGTNTVFADRFPGVDWALTPVSPSACYQEDAYYRQTCKPHVSQNDFPQLCTPKGMQIVLGAALVGTRM